MGVIKHTCTNDGSADAWYTRGLFLFPATRPLLIDQIHCSDITSQTPMSVHSVCNLKVRVFCAYSNIGLFEAT